MRAKSALLACGSALVALLLAELALPALLDLEKVTLTYDELLGFKGRSHVRTIWKREMGDYPRIVETNAHGFHDRERRLEKEKGVYRVVFLGDSFLEAYQVPVEDNFSQRLSKRLSSRMERSDNDAGRQPGRVEALNQGVHGYGLGVHYLYVKERLSRWQPDGVVLVLFLGNDLHDNFAPMAANAVPQFDLRGDSLHYQPPPPYGAVMWLRDNLLARSAIMRLTWLHVVKQSDGMRAVARRMGMMSTPAAPARHDPAVRARMLAVAQLQIGAIATSLSSREVPLVTYVIPDPFRVRDAIEAAQQIGRSDRESVVLTALQRESVPYLYPRDEFATRIAAGETIYRNRYGHFTTAGHQLSAALLEPLLLKQLERDVGAAPAAAQTEGQD